MKEMGKNNKKNKTVIKAYANSKLPNVAGVDDGEVNPSTSNGDRKVRIDNCRIELLLYTNLNQLLSE